jgi:hypothetical protein
LKSDLAQLNLQRVGSLVQSRDRAVEAVF